MKALFSYLILSLLFSCKQEHGTLGVEVAKQELNKALNDKSEKPTFTRHLIKDQKAAVETVEPILFNTYGKDNIINEKPYEVYLINGYWVLMGTLPKNMVGGTFLVILSAKDGRVIKLTHGK